MSRSSLFRSFVMRLRSFFHRLGAVLCGVLVLQLTLLGPVSACTTPTMAGGGVHDMPGMPDAVTSSSGHDRRSGDESCQLPMSARHCAAVACTTIALAPGLVSPPPAAASTPSTQVVVEPSVLESGNPTAPELPPPRV